MVWLDRQDAAESASNDIARERRERERREAENVARQRAELEAEQAARRAWEASIDARATVDAAALASAEKGLDDAVNELDRITAALGKQRDNLAALEARSAAALVDASIEELERIAAGRKQAADEIRGVRLVIDELTRRQSAAREAVDAARSEVGRVRTAGLDALADDMAAGIALDAADLAERMRELAKVQTLIGERGGSRGGRLVALQGNANRLAAMASGYMNAK